MTNSTGKGRVALRALGVLIVLLALAGRLGPAAADARRAEAPLDLAAMALTPADLEGLGLEGYGSDFGDLLTLQAEAEAIAATGDMSEAEATELLEDAGFVRSYSVRTALAQVQGGSGTYPTRGVFCHIYEFADEDGAEDLFSFLAGVDIEDVDEVDGTETIGDESVMTRWAWTDSELGDPVASLDLSFRTGRVFGKVHVWDVARDDEDEEPVEPEVNEIEVLANRLFERVEDGLDGDLGSGLSNRVLRLAVDSHSANVNEDRYMALDGQALRSYAESDEMLADDVEWVDDAQLVDVYTFEETIPAGRKADEGDPYLLTRLFRFEDPNAAEEWLAGDGPFATLAAAPPVTEVEPRDEIEDLGDGTAVAYVEEEWHGSTMTGYAVFVLVDDTVAEVWLDSADGIELDTVVELAELQVECLEDGGCVEPMEAPDDL